MSESTQASRAQVAWGGELRRLLLVVTGSMAASDLPFWGTWMREFAGHLDIKVLVSPAALTFATLPSLRARVSRDVRVDSWQDHDHEAVHVTLTEWAQGVLVHPCSMNYLGLLANGLADRPSLLAIHCTTAPVVVAPALPPGGAQSAVFRRHMEALADRPDLVVAQPIPGKSTTTGAQDAWAPALLPDCLMTLDKMVGPSDGAVAEDNR